MNQLYLKVLRPALLTLSTCVLVALTASKTVFSQQTPAKAAASPSSQLQNAKPLVFNVTVTNKKGHYVTGLERSHFTILDDKLPQDITHFAAQDEPVSIGILLDVSGSMFDRNTKDLMMTLFNESLAHFVEQSNRGNEYFLAGFNERPQLLMDWTSKVVDLNATLRKIGAVGPKGRSTALYDTCYLGIEKVAASRHPKRALLLISDGQDNNSNYSFKELRRLLGESDVLLYVVGILGPVARYSILGTHGISVLEELARVSGGISFFPEKSFQVRDAFNLIATELRHQYSIGFNPVSYRGDSDWHPIKIRLAIPSDAPRELRHLSVRSREGYFRR
jgi:Ca-activated chloride channel homolog